jgi:hypothetical protein
MRRACGCFCTATISNGHDRRWSHYPTYDDFIWEKYRWGEALAVRDPQTNQPATRNVLAGTAVPHTTFTPGRQPTDRNHPFFEDTSIEGLQRRRVLFLA